MAKTKTKKVVAADKHMSGKDLLKAYTGYVETTPAKVESTSELAPIKAADYVEPTELSNEVREHLHVLDIHKELSVPEFRDYTQTGDIAINILNGYVAKGFCTKVWKNSRSVFSLTPAGLAALD